MSDVKKLIEDQWKSGPVLHPGKVAFLEDKPPKGEGHEKLSRCVIGTYVECAAKTGEACLCRQMPRRQYLVAIHQRYGFDAYIRLKKPKDT